MNRLLLTALSAAAAALAAASASSQQINHYVATPATAPGKVHLVTRGTPWFVRGDSVVAPKAPETDAKVCAMVAARIGTLTAFSAGGAPFAAADLATCNAAAPTKTAAN